MTDITRRRLWKSVRIGRGLEASTTLKEAHQSCDALLRLPGRTAYVQRLIICPCTWAWDWELLGRFHRILTSVPQLLGLHLFSFHFHSKELDTSFAPLLQLLAKTDMKMQLRCFRHESRLRQESDLMAFVIETLIGVDIYHPLHLPSGILPSLIDLRCAHMETARQLSQPRRLRAISIAFKLERERGQELANLFGTRLRGSCLDNIHLVCQITRSWLNSPLRC
jgi:hypothetical protein